MSVRIEWVGVADVFPRVLVPGQKAPDGQTPEEGPFALLLGPCCIEGSQDDLMKMLVRARKVLATEGDSVWADEYDADLLIELEAEEAR